MKKDLTISHVPAQPGWFAITPIAQGSERLPLSMDHVYEPIIAWLLETTADQYKDDGAHRIEGNTFVKPICLDGTPRWPYAICHPDKTLEIVGDQSIFDNRDLQRYFTEWVERDIAIKAKQANGSH